MFLPPRILGHDEGFQELQRLDRIDPLSYFRWEMLAQPPKRPLRKRENNLVAA
jgi:hypothetical protein